MTFSLIYARIEKVQARATDPSLRPWRGKYNGSQEAGLNRVDEEVHEDRQAECQEARCQDGQNGQDDQEGRRPSGRSGTRRTAGSQARNCDRIAASRHVGRGNRFSDGHGDDQTADREVGGSSEERSRERP